MGLFACGQPNGDAHAVYADPFSPCQLVPASATEREILAARYLDDLGRPADREPACVPEARVPQLKEKIAAGNLRSRAV